MIGISSYAMIASLIAIAAERHIAIRIPPSNAAEAILLVVRIAESYGMNLTKRKDAAEVGCYAITLIILRYRSTA
jgi:hypothetical protein